MKRILPLILGIVVVAAGVAVVSAFEAHIINVTAHIENALTVSNKQLSFGTVFPQEYLEKEFTISLSDSFQSAARVDDVEYKIVRKPKCKADDPGNPVKYMPVDYATHLCPQGYTAMLSLCPFLSMTPKAAETGDVAVPSYFNGQLLTCNVAGPSIALGHLAKSGTDLSDTWVADLKAPPFVGYVAQDWPAGCPVLEGDPNGTDLGCDLWVEVTGISLPGTTPSPSPTPNICNDQADVMQVLDRSNSIDATKLALLKTASHAFVTALAPTTDGVYMGQSSFSDNGTLDLQLTSNSTAINNAIDALVTGGWTNLYEGLHLAQGAFSLPDSRPAAPNIMVVITDGNTNRPTPDATARAMATAEATADKTAGTEIYVVGVGADVDSNFLKNNIATDASHYFSAANYGDLQAILEAIAHCQH